MLNGRSLRIMHRKVEDTKGVIRSNNTMKNKPDNVKRKGTKRQTMVNKIHEPNTNWDRNVHP